MGGACGAPRLLGIYLISKMHTKTIQKIQKAYIKTYEEDVKIYKDIENSQGQGAFFWKHRYNFQSFGGRGSGSRSPHSKSWKIRQRQQICEEGQKIGGYYWPFNFLIFQFFFGNFGSLFSKIGLRDLKNRNPEVKICLGTNFHANPTKI